jgi:hypothetical protein
MAYWIQEFGGQDKNRKDWRMYHCDYRTDIDKLPTNTTEGVKQDGDYKDYTLAHYGDQCLCLEDSTLWELRNEPNDWKEL